MGKWGKVNLENVCFILDSQRVPITASERIAGSYPYYGANGLQDYVNDYIFDDELVLLAEDGGNFGSKDRPIAYRVSGKCWVNNHAHVLKAKDNVNVDYLCYSLMFYDVSNLVNGATRQKLTQADMKKMVIPLPSLEEQQKIAATLDKVTDLINLRKKELERLDLLVKSRFVEMFGDPVDNQMNWDTIPLEEVCSSIVDCPHSTPKYTNEDTGYMCIRTSIVKKNAILWDDVEFISEEEYLQRIKRKKPQKGDIIYTREGAILGIAAIIDRECNVALGQRSMLLSPNTTHCLPEFICYAMNFDSFFSRVTQGVSGSASPHINVADIRAFNIIMPPINLQKQFAIIVHATDKSTYNEEGKGLPFFQGNADFGKIHPSVRVWCSSPVKIALPNDILISVRAPIGALNIADTKCCIGRGLAALTVNESVCNARYLWYALQSKVNELNAKGTGSTFKAINKAALADTEIPYVPLDKQKKIADIFDKLSFAIDKRDRQIEILNLLVKSRFVEMFGDPIANPKGWERNQLKDLSLKIGSGATPKGGRECYGIEGISLIRSMNVHNGIFEYKELAHISDEQAIKLDNVIVKENDVLLNITGASVARSCVVPNDVLPARVNQHVCIIRCNDLILPCFLNNLLINNRFQSLLWSIAGSGATREAITKQQVEKLQIIIPPINLQNQFSDFVTKTDKSKYAVKKSLEKLETLKKALMQEYFG